MERLSVIYHTYCLKHSDGSIESDEYDWIPGKILRCFYDKDFRSDTVEDILCTSLFPAQFSVKYRVANWIRLFSGFDRVEVKALQKILEHKQRLQLEMHKYLSLRQTCQEIEAPELQKRFVLCFKIMSPYFIDPTKAEENFLIIDQLKDANIWNILSTLLDPNTSSLQASSSRILASFSPSLLSGTEDTLVHFLEDDDEVIKEGALHVLAKAGGTIREQLGESSSSLALILERICLEGSRRQAKYAVNALVAITKDDGLMSLSVLYKRLVDMLKEKTHLPAVLQSLGCIAQTAMPVFETRETEVEEFIKRNILECSVKTEDIAKESWDYRSEVCSLKIFGIKALVKSYLPVKDAHLRLGIDDLIRVLHNFLSFGEISKDIESSSVDKAHLRLASAKAVLRLSKHWEHKITVDIFYLTSRTLEVGFLEVKKIFLDKVHQYIKDRLLDPKYACAFFLDLESQQSYSEEDKHNLSDIIQMCQQGKARQLPLQADSSSSGVYPKYILPYLVHSLAHHSSCPDVDECKDVKAFEPIYRFYEGVVKSYDHQKRKHVVLYNDGDVEVLQLDKVRWELTDNRRTPTKRLKSSKSPRSKGGSSEPKTKSLVGSKQTKKSSEISPSSKVTGKRTPRKSSKQGQEWASKWKSPEVMEAKRNETSESSDPEAPTFTKFNNLDTEEEPSDEEDKNIGGGNESDKDDKSVSDGKQAEDGGSLAGEDKSDRDEKSVPEEIQMEDEDNRSTDTEDLKEEPDSSNKQLNNVDNTSPNASESGEEERSQSEGNKSPNVSKENSMLIADEEDKPVPLQNETYDADSTPIGQTTSDKKSSASYSGDAEFSDDEPLSVWKSRVGKSAEGK